jgi:hypothetical protein
MNLGGGQAIALELRLEILTDHSSFLRSNNTL